MKPIFFILLILVNIPLFAQNKYANRNDSYGFIKQNPLRLNYLGRKKLSDTVYLEKLRDKNKQKIEYFYKGQCCAFLNDKAVGQLGLLSVYLIKSKNKTRFIYIDRYNKGPVKAPKGFRLK